MRVNGSTIVTGIMSVYKRGRSTYVYVSYRGLEHRQSYGNLSLADARLVEARVRQELADEYRRGILGQEPRRTFDEALVRWTEGEMSRLKGARYTRNHMKQVLPFTKGKLLTQGLEIAEAVKADGIARGLAAGTINQRLAWIRRLLNLAEHWGWLKEPLGARVKLLPLDNRRYEYLTAEELWRLAEAATVAREAILQLGLTGARPSELWLEAPKIMQRKKGKVWLIRKTKSRKARVVPLHPEIADFPWPPAISRYQFRYRFELARAELGRPGFQIRDLRHTFVSLFAASGGTLQEVQPLLGHSNLAVTTRYLHLFPDALEDAIARMGERVHSTKCSTGKT